MRNKKSIVIAVIVIVLLLAGILILNFADFSSEDGGTAVTSAPSYTVFSSEVSDLKSVEVRTADTSIKAENINGEWTIGGMDKSDVDPSKVSALVGTASSITSNRRIEDNVTDFAQYGLENPSISVIITGMDGSVNTLCIGDKSPTLGEYFIRLNNDTTVYTLYSHKVDTLLNPLSYYSDFNRFNIDIDDINRIKIAKSDETIELKIIDDIDENTNNVWEMVSPYQSGANDDYIDDKILALIGEITLTNPVETKDGMFTESSPVITLTVKPYDNTTGKYGEEYIEELTVGKSDGEKTYVKYKGKAFEVPTENVSFTGEKSFDIVSKLQALVDISEVKSVTVEYNGKKHKIDVSKNGSKYSFKLDGKNTDSKTSQTIYQQIISLAADGVYNGEPAGDTFLKISYEDKADTVIEFKTINDLSCALVRDGKTDFTIRKSKLLEFIELFDTYVNEAGGN